MNPSSHQDGNLVRTDRAGFLRDLWGELREACRFWGGVLLVRAIFWASVLALLLAL